MTPRTNVNEGMVAGGSGSDSASSGQIKKKHEKGGGDAGRRRRGWKKSLVRTVKPINHAEERTKFMQKKFDYNPQFQYSQPIDDILPMYNFASNKYLDQAVHILKNTLVKFGSYEEFARASGGQVMAESTIARKIDDYLADEGLEDKIDVVVSSQCVSRACLTNLRGGKHRLTVKHDIREGWIDGLLRHEIGTHYIRSFNNSKQPWRKKRKRSDHRLLPANPTEEGLASLHTILFRECPSMWRAALLYYTTYMASKMSFSKLFHNLERFVLDPDVRFDFCLRAKRGLGDTSKPGGFCKDQVYLQGGLEILKNRKTIDFHQLMKLGKISHRDINKASANADTSKCIVPSFMRDMSAYHARLDYIVKYNDLKELK